MTTTSAQARRVARATRRIVDGGRGLGFGTTARWVLERGRSDQSDVEPENTSLTWVRADADATTVAWLTNYWSDSYDLASPCVEAALLDPDGCVVATEEIVLPTDGTVALDVRALCQRHDIALPYHGQLLLRLRGPRLVAGRPVQVFAEYRRDDGECSGVHGQYGLVDTPAAQVVSSMRVVSDADHRTGFVITNGYDGPGGPHAMRASATIHAADGRTWHAPIPTVDPQATVIVYADELVPDLTAELGGAPGHARVQLACPSSRIATFIEDRTTGRIVVNHGTVDRVFDQEPGIPATAGSVAPVASVCVVIDARHDTVLGLPNVWGPRADDYTAEIAVFDLDGRAVAHTEVRVGRNCLQDVSLRDLVGLLHGERLQAEVRLHSPAPERERPHTFDVLVGMWVDGQLRAEAQVGSDFYNAPVPDGVRWPDIRRTRIFGRVDETAGRETWISLAYPIATGGTGDRTHPLLTLLSADGSRRAERLIELHPHGGLIAPLRELMPEVQDVLGPDGFGQLRVRDTEARLYGYSWVKHPSASTFPLDHLIGG